MPFLPELATFTATCTAEGCENAGESYTVTAAATNPFVICGGCGARIDEVVPA